MMPPLRKAVFPAAGLGTRFLPATKAQPKEMLPLVDKPIIQYGVEEAVASGFRTSSWSQAAARTPSRITSTCRWSSRRFSKPAARRICSQSVRDISNMINVSYVRQGEALGLGHAVLVTRDLVGPRAVRGAARRRRHRRGSAGDQADARRVRAGAGPRARGRARAARRRLQLRHRRDRREREAARRRLPCARSRREAAARGGAVGSGDHRALHPDPRHLRRRSRRPGRIAPAKSSSPTDCGTC